MVPVVPFSFLFPFKDNNFPSRQDCKLYCKIAQHCRTTKTPNDAAASVWTFDCFDCLIKVENWLQTSSKSWGTKGNCLLVQYYIQLPMKSPHHLLLVLFKRSSHTRCVNRFVFCVCSILGAHGLWSGSSSASEDLVAEAAEMWRTDNWCPGQGFVSPALLFLLQKLPDAILAALYKQTFAW